MGGGEREEQEMSTPNNKNNNKKFDSESNNSVNQDKTEEKTQTLGGASSSSCYKKGTKDFIKDSTFDHDTSNVFSSKPQELTFSYLCENNPKVGGLGFVNKPKDLVLVNDCVERDFLNLTQTDKSNSSSSSSKRRVQEEEEGDGEGVIVKKPKLENTLNLSLALPDVSLSLTAPKPSQSVYSNDFTVASRSYSYSHPFSHNPSCSLTRNSTDFDCSVGRDDQIWCGGEGTNGSVHSRFRPVGDGMVALNHGNGGFGVLQGNRAGNKDSCSNNHYNKTTSSDNISFFPSELPARPQTDAYSGDSRRRESENFRGLDGVSRARKLSRPERILLEIVSESVPFMAQIVQELSEEMLLSIKEHLRDIMLTPEKSDELVGLQSRLERRADLTKEALLKCQKDQLEILVSVKMGLASFIMGKTRISNIELVEIFLFMRCRNVNCKSILPVEDCDCKFCSTDKGFCSTCTCPICMNFDCASNTCSWVGCDVCSHWCHAACSIQKDLIKPGPSLKGPSGTTEVQFHCIACNHASEMFGFVKDVFVHCAKDWALETLIKELDCVRNIFKRSEDVKGKELLNMAEGILAKLESKILSPSDACNIITKFFNYAESRSGFPVSGISVKEMMPTEPTLRKDTVPVLPTTSVPPKYTIYNSANSRHDSVPKELPRNDLKAAILGDLKIDDGFNFGKMLKKDEFESLDSIVRIKEAEARMFQDKADEARREAEQYRQLIRTKSEKLEEEYAEKLSKLCLQETEERRRKKLEEFKLLENSNCDYYNMKIRMQAEIAGLLERMEATKQQWV